MRYIRCLVVLALVGILVVGSVGIAAAKGPPESNPGKGPQGHGKNQNFVGNVTSACEGNITFTAKQGWEVTLALTDGTTYMVPRSPRGKWTSQDSSRPLEGTSRLWKVRGLRRKAPESLKTLRAYTPVTRHGSWCTQARFRSRSERGCMLTGPEW